MWRRGLYDVVTSCICLYGSTNCHGGTRAKVMPSALLLSVSCLLLLDRPPIEYRRFVNVTEKFRVPFQPATKFRTINHLTSIIFETKAIHYELCSVPHHNTTTNWNYSSKALLCVALLFDRSIRSGLILHESFFPHRRRLRRFRSVVALS